MPKKYRVLSGDEVVRIFIRYGFEIKRQVGSHIRLTLKQSESSVHITIPKHTELKLGTLHAIRSEFAATFGEVIAKKEFDVEQ